MFYIKKEDILNEVIEYYLNSGDFNGLPLYNVSNYSYELLCELIDDNLIEILNEADVINPHIRGFDIETDKEKQKEYVNNKENHSVLYPTNKALETLPVDYSSPYTAIMSAGCEQFKIIYFDIEILERYVNNPKYFIIDFGYRGTICLHDEYVNSDFESEYIKDYGMAYIDGEKFQRAVGVFAYDLSKLCSQKQLLWKSFEIKNQDKCEINQGFIKNLLLGDWVTDFWVFHAVLSEMETINKLCQSLNIPPMFNHTYGYDSFDVPEGYRNIFLPTKKNYYDFVLVLEKLLIHNISYKTFITNGLRVNSVNRNDENGNIKGTLVLLTEWLDVNTSVSIDQIQEVIIMPLKNIRKIRQKPAHELTSNEYNLDYYTEQFELINSAYISISHIRKLLSKNPFAKDVEIPDYLIDNTEIVNY